ncbi:MAG: nuclear transport factor 2 family protein [Burkholderiales bacterium]
MTTNTESEILALEAERCAAMLSGDESAMRRLFHDDMIFTHSTGLAETKSSFIGSIASGKFDYKRIEQSKERVRLYGDTALVSGQAEIDIDVDGAPRKLNLCYLAAWVRTQAGWQFVAWQSASIPA